MNTDFRKFDGLNEVRLLKFKERILWHQNNGGFSNDLQPLADHVNFKYLPESVVNFYKIIGFGTIGFNDCLVYDISKPFFTTDDHESVFFDEASKPDDNEFEGKVKDIIFLGQTVDGEIMGIVKNSDKDIVTTTWGNGGIDMLSYIEIVLLEVEEHVGIKCPL